MVGQVLDKSFYTQDDVLKIARNLLGKLLVTNINNSRTAGIIVETEAYAGISDKASHAYGGKRTSRTEIMYHEGGVAYIYLCYGIHSLFNVVTNISGIPHAVLIRGILPVQGKNVMTRRIKKSKLSKNSGYGPGKLTKLLGIHWSMSGIDLCNTASTSSHSIWIEDHNVTPEDSAILATPRIGIDYAGNDAKLKYRYIIKNPDIIYRGL